MNWLVRKRLPLFVFATAITLALLPFAKSLRYDQSVQSLFSANDPKLLTYNRTVEEFGGDTTCLAVYVDPELLTAQGMRRLQEFAERLARVPGVLSTNSLAGMPRPDDSQLFASFSNPLRQGAGTPESQRPRFRWKTLAEWFADPSVDPADLGAEILAAETYVDVLIGRDGETASVVMQFDRSFMANGTIAQSIRALRRLANELPPTPGQIVGSPAMISDVYESMNWDANVLATLSVVLMGAVILVIFRRLRWLLLPIGIVQATLVWTQSLMVLSNVRLSLVGAMTASMITVIGIATVIHIAIRYREESQVDHNPAEALKRALGHVMTATFWACATTGAGFAALCISRVGPVRDYGWLMAASSIFDCLAAFLLLPGGALLFERLRTEPREAIGEDVLESGLGKIVNLVNRHPYVTTALVLAILLFSLAGALRVGIETDFTKNFRADSPIIKGYTFVEERLGGAGLIELVFDAPKTLTPEFMGRLKACQEELRRIDGVTKVLSLADGIAFARGSMPKTVGFLAGGLIPDDAIVNGMQAVQPSVVRQLYNRELGRMRMVVRVREQSDLEDKRIRLARIVDVARRRLGESAEVTGFHVLLVFIVSSLLGDQWSSFLLASAIILAMTMTAFRSVRLGLVTFLPNVIPIVVVLGFMGWLGWKINVATAMIGSIAMGLVIDFSHHYVTRFVEEREAGRDVATAIGRTHLSTGKAVFFANLALTIGFLVLVCSNFLPTIQFGLLTSIAMFCGMVGNLVLLPILLRVAYWRAR